MNEQSSKKELVSDEFFAGTKNCTVEIFKKIIQDEKLTIPAQVYYQIEQQCKSLNLENFSERIIRAINTHSEFNQSDVLKEYLKSVFYVLNINIPNVDCDKIVAAFIAKANAMNEMPIVQFFNSLVYYCQKQ